jgi:hypothetical protein
MSNENLELWGRVGKTDPQYTKAYKGAGGFEGTAVNPLYTVRRLTEEFGQLGIGWGYDIIEDRFDNGHTVYDDNGNSIGILSTHTIRLDLWHMVGDKKAISTHYGHTPYVYKNKWGMQTDVEFAKKSLTDALNKAASMFGFNSDIYLGKYDDVTYVQEIGNEFALEEAEDKDAELIKQRQEYDDLFAKNLELIKTSVSIHELESIYKSIVRKAKHRGEEEDVKTLNKAAKDRKAELEKDKK